MAKTQANISKDQRDIAHDKLRIENHNLLVNLIKPFHGIYECVNSTPYFFPNTIITDKTKDIMLRKIDENDLNFNGYEKRYNGIYFENKSNMKKYMAESYIAIGQLEYLVNAGTMKILKQFQEFSDDLFEEKILNFQNSIICQKVEKFHEDQVEKDITELKEKYKIMIKSLKPYMDVSDILAPRKLGE